MNYKEELSTLLKKSGIVTYIMDHPVGTDPSKKEVKAYTRGYTDVEEAANKIISGNPKFVGIFDVMYHPAYNPDTGESVTACKVRVAIS